LHTIGPERVPGGEVIFAAADKKQAAIGFRESLGIVRADPRIAQAVRVSDAVNSSKRITYLRDSTFLETISSDADTQHGPTPSFALVDELHAWKKRDLWDAIRSGLPKTAGSLLIVATTAGRGQENVAFDLVEYARKIAKGEIDNPTFLPILFEAPADADWQDEALWHAVNPGLQHGYPSLSGLRTLANEAKDRPGERESFRQFNLNVWLDHSADPFVDMNVYDEGAASVDLEALRGEPCWLAVDLSSNSDLTVIVACWRDGDAYQVHPWFFCPADNLRARADRNSVPYPRWAEEGFITPTSGNVVDFRSVEDKIRELCEQFQVREIAFDPHLARNMLNNLLEDGYPAVEMRQGWVTMAPAIKELERAVVGRNLRHGGHPVLRWNFENIAVETDKAGNKAFHKGKSKDRIDGAVASAMAVARAAAGDGGSIYDAPDFRPEMMVL
jgi:phage terminase large subunit-like protein